MPCIYKSEKCRRSLLHLEAPQLRGGAVGLPQAHVIAARARVHVKVLFALHRLDVAPPAVERINELQVGCRQCSAGTPRYQQTLKAAYPEPYTGDFAGDAPLQQRAVL